jgi:predicted membrane-bound mannosyltransferase
VWDAVEAYKVWKKTGESGFHGYGWYKYLQWLIANNNYLEWVVRDGKGVAPVSDWESGEEPVLFLLACAGALIALRETRRRFPLFAALWGFGLLAAYSLIKYKTPWLVLSMLVPFAITGGYAIDWLYRRGAARRIVALLALGLALVVAAVQTIQLNYVHYDDEKYIYVYAHTKREYLDLMREIERFAERAGTKYETPINVAAPEYWPMPWYLRNYKRVGYQSRVIPATNEAVIIGSTAQSAEMQATNGAKFQLVGTYPMRPGVILNLYARRDLLER